MSCVERWAEKGKKRSKRRREEEGEEEGKGWMRKEESWGEAVLLVHRVALHSRDISSLPSPSGALGKLWGSQHTRLLPDTLENNAKTESLPSTGA